MSAEERKASYIEWALEETRKPESERNKKKKEPWLSLEQFKDQNENVIRGSE